MTDATEHTPGPLLIFQRNGQTGTYELIGTIDPSLAAQGGRPYALGHLLCERHAKARGYVW